MFHAAALGVRRRQMPSWTGRSVWILGMISTMQWPLMAAAIVAWPVLPMWLQSGVTRFDLTALFGALNHRRAITPTRPSWVVHPQSLPNRYPRSALSARANALQGDQRVFSDGIF
jgi:hypothetical protein